MIGAVLVVGLHSVVAGTPPSHICDADLVHVMPIKWNPVLEPHVYILVSILFPNRSYWAGGHGVLRGPEDEAREA